MGKYVNPGFDDFARDLKADHPAVDKSELIAFTNSVIDTGGRLVCDLRPRRFGKTFACRLLGAYYSKAAQRSLLSELKIAAHPSFAQYLGSGDLIYLDMRMLRLEARHSRENLIAYIQREVASELCALIPDLIPQDLSPASLSLPEILSLASLNSGRRFIIIIDAWDAALIRDPLNSALHGECLWFLHDLLESEEAGRYLRLCYMTGVLPPTAAAGSDVFPSLKEYTMISPGPLSPFKGITASELQALCLEHGMDPGRLRSFYAGYHLEGETVFSPYCVAQALGQKNIVSCWSQLGSVITLTELLELKLDGLQECVISMLGGLPHQVDVSSFKGSPSDCRSIDEVLTLLIHHGYLGYDRETGCAFIPGEELRLDFIRVIRNSKTGQYSELKTLSLSAVESVFEGRPSVIGALCSMIHELQSTPQSYGESGVLKSVLLTLFLSLSEDYLYYEETFAARGYSALRFKPRSIIEIPLLLLELKENSVPPLEDGIPTADPDPLRWEFEDECPAPLKVRLSYDPGNGDHSCSVNAVPPVSFLLDLSREPA